MQDSILPLDEFLQSLPLLDLLGGRRSMATFVGILPSAQFEPQRGAVQFQDLAEAVQRLAGGVGELGFVERRLDGVGAGGIGAIYHALRNRFFTQRARGRGCARCPVLQGCPVCTPVSTPAPGNRPGPHAARPHTVQPPPGESAPLMTMMPGSMALMAL